MQILITGGYGFIGRHCAAALAREGHVVICGGRGPHGRLAGCRHVEVDFTRDRMPGLWQPRLAGVDLVINAAGALASRRGESLESLHSTGPIALFDACAALGIRVFNISALGADDDARSAFHLTKRAADRHLLAVLPDSIVLQPSLVYGAGGASARMFDQLAGLPVIPLPGRGEQAVQPVHIDDLVQAVVLLAAGVKPPLRTIPLVGPLPLTLKRFLAGLRQAMGLGRARFLHVPMCLAELGMRLAALVGARWASQESLGMLARGNTADPAPLRALLGREARAVSAFIDPDTRDAVRLAAKIGWLSVLLRLSIAIVWFAAAIVSAGLYPLEQSVTLVEALGVRGTAALALVYLGIGVDTAFGLGTLFMRNRLWLWRAQLCTIVGYTVLITAWLPEFWLHPFGPVVKNIPMLAAIYALHELERG